MNYAQHDKPTVELEEVPSSPLGHRFMFVVLTLLAFVLFAPAVLLPILREHCELLAEEERLKAQIAKLENETKHRDELISAFAQDALINERLAILDLHYKKPGEVVLSVFPGSAGTAVPPPSPDQSNVRGRLNLPAEWPAWAHDAEHWAEQYSLIDLFLDSSTRPVFLLMSGGLVVAAFVIFAPDIRPRAKGSRQEAGVLVEPTQRVSG